MMPRTPSLRSLFVAWVCFSVSFSTVFQAFLTTFLIDSGYKTPIQNMDELFASDIKFSFEKFHRHIFKIGDETKTFTIFRNSVDFPSFDVCLEWAKYQKNLSIIFPDIATEIMYATVFFCW
jgi:hypothetical protein